MIIAIPVLENRLAADFRSYRQFDLIDTVNGEVKMQEFLTPPPVQPWRLPNWLQAHDVDVIIAGRMSQTAESLFQKAGIKVITGAPSLPPAEVAQRYCNDHLLREEDGNIH